MAQPQVPRSIAEFIRTAARLGKRAHYVHGLDGLEKIPNGKVPVDLSQVPALNEIASRGGKVTIGTGLNFGTLLRGVSGENGLLKQAVSMLGSPLVRNRLTILSALDPESPHFDFTTPLVILGANIRVQGASAKRSIPIRDFLEGLNKGLKKGELPVAIEFAKLAAEDRVGFFRVARVGRKGTISAAARLRMKRTLCTDVEIVVSGSSLIPLRVQEAEKCLLKQTVTEKTVQDAVGAAATEILALMGDTKPQERTLIEITVGRTLRDIVSSLGGGPA